MPGQPFIPTLATPHPLQRKPIHDPATFLHELAHAIHARLGDVKPGQDPHHETVAELTACTLAAIYDLDYTANAWRCISAYNKDPLRAIAATTDDVARIVQSITTLHGEPCQTINPSATSPNP